MTDVRILFVLGADPAGLYVDSYGETKLSERQDAGSVCPECSLKYQAFLEFAGQVYEAQFGQVSISIDRLKPKGKIYSSQIDSRHSCKSR